MAFGALAAKLVDAVSSEQSGEVLLRGIVWVSWVSCIGKPDVFFEQVDDGLILETIRPGFVVDNHFG